MSQKVAEYILKNFLKIGVGICIVIAFVYILSPFLIPLLLGGLLAMAFSPYVGFFMRLGCGRKASVLIISLTLFILGITPVTIVLFRGKKVLADFMNEQSLVVLKNKLEVKAYSVIDNLSAIYHIDPFEVREYFQKMVISSGTWAVDLATSFLSQLPNMAMLNLIIILTFYFFLVDEERIRSWFDRYFNFSAENGEKFISLMKSSCNEVFFSNVLTGTAQAMVISIGAFFTNTGDFFIVFFCTFFLSYIPVIGAGPVGFVLAAYAFIEGRIGAGIALVVIGLFAGIADNLIRPYLSSRGEVKVPVFVSFLSIIGGVLLIGLPGLFLGPLIASLTYGALPIIYSEYFLDREVNVKDF